MYSEQNTWPVHNAYELEQFTHFVCVVTMLAMSDRFAKY
jgi:hypothetical protein